MPRTPNITRPSKLTLHLPEDIRAKLDLYLFSEIEGRIPYAAYQKFLIERINEFFTGGVRNCPQCGHQFK
jgi:hypothetical protein